VILNTFPNRRMKSCRISAVTLIKCSHAFPNSSEYFPRPHSSWKLRLPHNLMLLSATFPARMASGRAVSWLEPRMLPSENYSATKPWPTTKESQAIICRFLSSNSSRGCRSFVFISSTVPYAEGWGLYAETLGKEIGFFQDPGSDYGRLSLELLRAVRLVVDTGIHSQGWTREEALADVHANGVSDEIDRYLAWPAQALSYKVGQLKFLSCVTAPSNSLAPASISRSFMTRS